QSNRRDTSKILHTRLLESGNTRRILSFSGGIGFDRAVEERNANKAIQTPKSPSRRLFVSLAISLELFRICLRTVSLPSPVRSLATPVRHSRLEPASEDLF